MDREKKELKAKKFFNFLRPLVRSVFKLVYPYELHGNLSTYGGPLIIIGNHYSYIDVAFPLLVTNEAIHFLAKQELSKESAFMNWFLNKTDSILVKRDGSDVQPVKDCLRILKGGGVISLFPEGTRNHSYKEILPFKSGAAALSIKTQAPIVPIVKITRMRLFHKTHIVFGDPIEFREFYGKKVSKEDLEACDEKLRESMQNMRLAFLDRHPVKIKSDKV